MGKKGGSSKAPKPDPRIAQAAQKQADLGQDWLSFAKDAFEQSKARQETIDKQTADVMAQQQGVADQQLKWAQQDRDRYNNVFVPAQDKFVNTAMNYGTQEKQEEAAAEASADVQNSAAKAQEAQARNAASMGVNPASGRYAGIDQNTVMNTALANAGAQNQARQLVRDKALGLQYQAANMGNMLPQQSNQTMGLGLGAGSDAIGLAQRNQQLFNGSTGIVNSGYAGAMSGYQGMSNSLNNLYGNQLNAWQAQNQQNAQKASGLGSFLGGVAGIASSFLPSDKNLKTNKRRLRAGAGLEAVNSMPIDTWKYKPGVADEGEHIGTYAQDFKKATGKGDGKTIPTVDAIGISMKAIQDLSKEVKNIERAIGLKGAAK
ncbi:tail fiber domain-containing protein [Bartonella apis]|uniref:tail fiber domain-containing protein n=1 Tax=Bartonella apis TaxID=1686310 RepID=UPI00242B2CAD|nr:tail fiber domain-containing protein [Bartonella apis]